MSEEVKDKKKYTFKVAFISVICTLLFIIILLLFVLLGLKKCSNNKGNNTSSSSSSSQKYESNKLDNLFKKIVWTYLDYNGLEVALSELNDVIAVTYTDSSASFDLSISVKSTTNRVFHYQVSNVSYSNHEDFLGYLLDDSTDLLLDSLAGFSDYSYVNESIVTDKVNNRYAVSQAPTNVKYFSGFYFENNEYRVYQKKELVSNNPFNESADQVIDSSSLLFGYYQSLLAV